MKKRRRGIACMWYPIGFPVAANPGAVPVKVNEDGTANALTGAVDIGQGSMTVLAQIAAEELGIAPADVTMVTADADSTPMDSGPIASRATYVTGNAVQLAAAKAKEILFEGQRRCWVFAPINWGPETGRFKSPDSRRKTLQSVMWHRKVSLH